MEMMRGTARAAAAARSARTGAISRRRRRRCGAGRKKNAPPSEAAAEAAPAKAPEPTLPPPPPEPTQKFEPPLDNIRGVPVLRVHELRLRADAACVACLKGPPRANRRATRPRTAIAPRRPARADVYYPTEQQWAGDPLEYINAIRPEAEKYGVLQHRRPAVVAARSSGCPADRRPALPHARAGGDRAAEPPGGAVVKRAQGERGQGASAALEAAGLSRAPSWDS